MKYRRKGIEYFGRLVCQSSEIKGGNKKKDGTNWREDEGLLYIIYGNIRVSYNVLWESD